MIYVTKTLYYECVYLTRDYFLTTLKEMGYNNPDIIQKEKNYIIIRLSSKTPRTLKFNTYYVKDEDGDWIPYTKEEFEVV